MASPTIALRFRDTTPGVDTIAAHREIIAEKGVAWWGWWKKPFEEDHLAYFSSLPTDKPIEAFILDRSTRRMFRTVASQWSIATSASVDLTMVPEYYRDQESEVFGWFMLTQIEETIFADDIANKFGDHTLVVLNGEEGLDSTMAARKAVTSSKSCVLHLSDLHFGPSYDYIPQNQSPQVGDSRKTLTQCLVADLERIGLVDDIAAVIVTGDFITEGDWNDEVRGQVLREFSALRTALKMEPEQIIAVPGNHDVVRYSKGSPVDLGKILVKNQTSYKHEREFRTFVDELTGRGWKESLNYVYRLKLESADLLVCVLNSCTILATEWTEYGYVGDNGLDVLKLLAAETIQRPTFKFMALHHHLLPVTRVEVPQSKGVTLSLDASELLDAAQEAGVHIALHGHLHMPRLARYQTIPLMDGQSKQPLHVVSNGSTGASQSLRPNGERNTYCLFKLTEDKAHLWMRELRPDGRQGANLFNGSLETSPEGVSER